MEVGFVMDLGHSNRRRVARWVAGTPEASFWTGLRTSGKAQYEVTTYRCRRCGLLKAYASDKV